MNNNIVSKSIYIIILVAILITTFTNVVYANMQQIYNPTTNPFSNVITMVISVIQVVGVSIAVIMLTYIGIKYIMASPEGKADLKGQLFPYLIGCVLLFAGAGLIGIIANVANEKIR